MTRTTITAISIAVGFSTVGAVLVAAGGINEFRIVSDAGFWILDKALTFTALVLALAALHRLEALEGGE